jgi:cell wall-associated NlpC family hydrolase
LLAEAVAFTYDAFAVFEGICPPHDLSICPDRGGAPTNTTGDFVTFRQRLATFVLAASVLGGGFLAMGAGSAGAVELPPVAVAATIDPVSTSAAAALATMGTANYAGRLQSTANAVAATLKADATKVDATVEVDGALLQQAWLRADQPHQIALLSALTQVGVPYHRNTSKAGVGFDCSGLTAFAWGQAGVELTRRSSTQIRNAAARTIDTAQAGDLVYYPGHVMLWLGVDNLIVHAPQRGRNVEFGHFSNRRVSVRNVKLANPIG